MYGNKLLITGILCIVVTITVLLLSNQSQKDYEPVMMNDLIAETQRIYLYVEQNTNHSFTEHESSGLMRLAGNDPKRAVEI